MCTQLVLAGRLVHVGFGGCSRAFARLRSCSAASDRARRHWMWHPLGVQKRSTCLRCRPHHHAPRQRAPHRGPEKTPEFSLELRRFRFRSSVITVQSLRDRLSLLVSEAGSWKAEYWLGIPSTEIFVQGNLMCPENFRVSPPSCFHLPKPKETTYRATTVEKRQKREERSRIHFAKRKVPSIFGLGRGDNGKVEKVARDASVPHPSLCG